MIIPKRRDYGVISLLSIDCTIVIALCLFNITTPLIQAISINSDQLTIISLAEDILRNPHFDVYYWNFSRAPYFFPDLALTMALKAFVYSDAAIAASMLILQSAFTAGAGVVFSALLARSAAQRASTVALYGSLMILAFIGTRHGWSPDAIVWPFVSYSHAGALDLTLVGFLALTRNRYAPPGRLLPIVLSTALTSLAYCSDKIAIVLFLPSASLYLAASARTDSYARLLTFVAVQIIAIIAMLTVDHLLYFQIMESNSISGLQDHIVYIVHFFTAQPVSFQIVIAFAVAITTLVFVTSSISLSTRPEGDAHEVGLLFLLSSSSLIDLLLTIWLWSGEAPSFARYAVMVEFAGPVLLVCSLQGRWFRVGWAAKAGLPILCAVILLSIVTWDGTLNPLAMIDAQRRRGTELEACVAENGLHSGFAAYWLARQSSSSTDWRVQVDQFFPTQPAPFFWGSDLIWFFERLTDGSPVRHDFIILDDLPPEQVFKEYGRPDEVKRCGDHTLAIYRDSEKLQGAVDLQVASVLKVDSIREHLPHRVLARLLARQLAFGVDDLHTIVGHRGNGSITLMPADGPGYGLFGPYISLIAGSYTVDIAFACSGTLDGSYFEISAGKEQRRLAGWEFGDHPEGCDGQTRHARLSLDARQPVSMVEVRTFYGGLGNLSITDVRMGYDSGV